MINIDLLMIKTRLWFTIVLKGQLFITVQVCAMLSVFAVFTQYARAEKLNLHSESSDDSISSYIKAISSCGLPLTVSNPSAQLDEVGNIIGYKCFVVPDKFIRHLKSYYLDTTLINYSMKHLNSSDTILAWSSNIILHYLYGQDVTFLIKYSNLRCEMWFIEEKEKYSSFWEDFLQN